MSGRLRRILLAAAVIVLLVFVSHPLWLHGLGSALVRDDGPAHADLALVLAGDYDGQRIIHAAELVKQGYVPRVLVSGPMSIYGIDESELAVSFAVSKGYPKEWFMPMPLTANSTLEEARVLVPALRRMGVKQFLLVTNDYHTRRAGRIFARAGGDIGMRVVAAPDRQFRAADWWKTREGRKQCFFEWSKTVAELFGW